MQQQIKITVSVLFALNLNSHTLNVMFHILENKWNFNLKHEAAHWAKWYRGKVLSSFNFLKIHNHIKVGEGTNPSDLWI